MKKQSFSLFLLSLLIFSAGYGCRALLGTRTITETDIATSVTVTRKRFFFNRNLERKTPFVSLTKTVTRRTGPDNNTSYTFYDVLVLDQESFTVRNKIFVIIDGEVFPVTVRQERPESVTTTSTDTKTLSTSDSTSVTVVTGYSQSHLKYFKLEYPLSPGIIERMKSAGEILFRYYAGPNMMTVRFRGKYLGQLKEMI
jgi:hypothetical protein